ncbi:hypothetical protein Hanom_Chr17g01583901 [Helianthus anomalus]
MERFSLLSKEKRDVFQSVEKWVGIGESFGKIVQVGQHDVWDSDLSYDYVGVLVSEGKRIQEEVVVQWKGRRYRERGVEVSPVNRILSTSSENPTTPISNGVIEGLVFSGEAKESVKTVHIDNIADREVSKNNGEAVVVDKETDVIFGASLLGSNFLGNEGKSPNKKR